MCKLKKKADHATKGHKINTTHCFRYFPNSFTHSGHKLKVDDIDEKRKCNLKFGCQISFGVACAACA